MYYIYKRSDNYVFAVTHKVLGWKTQDGRQISFELLKTFDKWSAEAAYFMAVEQEKANAKNE